MLHLVIRVFQKLSLFSYFPFGNLKPTLQYWQPFQKGFLKIKVNFLTHQPPLRREPVVECVHKSVERSFLPKWPKCICRFNREKSFQQEGACGWVCAQVCGEMSLHLHNTIPSACSRGLSSIFLFFMLNTQYLFYFQVCEETFVKHCTISINQVWVTYKFDRINKDDQPGQLDIKVKWKLQYGSIRQKNLQVAVNETVKHCYRPLVSDCDVEGKLFFCLTIFISIAKRCS